MSIYVSAASYEKLPSFVTDGSKEQDYTYIQMLIQRVHCVWPRGVGRRRQDIWVLDYDNDVWRVPASCSFRVVRVDRPALDRCQCRFNVPALI